jgi:hypothetical protein
MQIEQVNLRERIEQVRLTVDAQLAEIRVGRPDLSHAQIGKKFGISQKVIRRVMKQFNILRSQARSEASAASARYS